MKITEILESTKSNPVYHGTSTRLWKKINTGTLYLTNDYHDAEIYAEEASESGGKPIIIKFSLDELLSLVNNDNTLEFEPDWGWQDGEQILGHQPTWQESLKHIHSFSITNFKQQYKALGVVISL